MYTCICTCISINICIYIYTRMHAYTHTGWDVVISSPERSIQSNHSRRCAPAARGLSNHGILTPSEVTSPCLALGQPSGTVARSAPRQGELPRLPLSVGPRERKVILCPGRCAELLPRLLSSMTECSQGIWFSKPGGPLRMRSRISAAAALQEKWADLCKAYFIPTPCLPYVNSKPALYQGYMSQSFILGLVSATMSSWGTGMSLTMVMLTSLTLS